MPDGVPVREHFADGLAQDFRGGAVEQRQFSRLARRIRPVGPPGADRRGGVKKVVQFLVPLEERLVGDFQLGGTLPHAFFQIVPRLEHFLFGPALLRDIPETPHPAHRPAIQPLRMRVAFEDSAVLEVKQINAVRVWIIIQPPHPVECPGLLQLAPMANAWAFSSSRPARRFPGTCQICAKR